MTSLQHSGQGMLLRALALQPQCEPRTLVQPSDLPSCIETTCGHTAVSCTRASSRQGRAFPTSLWLAPGAEPPFTAAADVSDGHYTQLSPRLCSRTSVPSIICFSIE